MPVIIILIVVAIYVIKKIYDELTRSTKIYTPDEIKSMNRAMIGKSKSEKKVIFKTYKKGIPNQKETHNNNTKK